MQFLFLCQILFPLFKENIEELAWDNLCFRECLSIHIFDFWYWEHIDERDQMREFIVLYSRQSCVNCVRVLQVKISNKPNLACICHAIYNVYNYQKQTPKYRFATIFNHLWKLTSKLSKKPSYFPKHNFWRLKRNLLCTAETIIECPFMMHLNKLNSLRLK